MSWLGLVVTGLLVGANAVGSDTLAGSRRDSGGALGTLCTPAFTCGPDALTQNIQMEAPAALSVWA